MSRRIVSCIGLAFSLAAGSTRAQVTTVEYIHTDALGSPVAITNSAGAVVERIVYEPYGKVVSGPTQDGPGYAGHVLDVATGLNYMQQRYYDPQLGMFLSVDPVTAYDSPVVSFNRYRYANSNPYSLIDPDGRAACPKELDGTCVDSPSSETGTAYQAGPTQQQQAVDAQVRSASRSGSLSDGTRLDFNGEEQGFKASAEGTSSNPMVSICQRCADGSTREGGMFNVRALGADESGGHTHTNRLSGLPGPEDGSLARVTDKSAYVVSQRGAFSIEKTDVGYRIRLIDGARPTSTERREMRSTIDGWNRNKGGSGVSCTTTTGRC